MAHSNRRYNRLYKSCLTKRRYEKLSDAFIACNAVKGFNARDMGVYKCPNCGFYHIGHSRFGYPMSTLPYFGA